jgi:glycosyltransferase involved in cell wall biosynthesis
MYSKSKTQRLNEDIRILNLIPSVAGGGAEPVALHIARHQAEFFNVDLATWLDHDLKSIDPLPGTNVNLVQLRRPLTGPLGAMQLINAIRRHIRRGAVTHIVSHLYYTNHCVAIALLFAKRRPECILVEHGFPVTRPWLIRNLTNFLYRRSRLAVCAGPLADYWKMRLELPEVLMMPNPITLPSRERLAPSAATGSTRYCAVGRLDPVKNFEFLINVMAHLPGNTSLEIYGGGSGTYREALTEQVAALNLSDRVTFKGPVDRALMLAGLQQFAGLLITSDCEGEPTVVLEAGALGVPVMGRDTPGVGACVRKVGGRTVPATASATVFAEQLISTRLVNSVEPTQWLPLHDPMQASHNYCTRMGLHHE